MYWYLDVPAGRLTETQLKALKAFWRQIEGGGAA
jgi:hypothetical protein